MANATDTQPIYNPTTNQWTLAGQPIAAPAPTVGGGGSGQPLATPITSAPTGATAPTVQPSQASVAPEQQSIAPQIPAATFYKPETAVPGYGPETVFNQQGQPLNYDQYIAAGGAKDFSNVKKVSNLEQGLATAKATGPAPQTAAEGIAGVAKYTPPITPTTTPNVDNFYATNKTWQQQTQELMDFLSPPEQTKSFEEASAKIKADKNVLAGLNLQDMNFENLKAGTEEDIANEITKAGGFATSSQVKSLSIMRNNVLIKEQNILRQKMQFQQDLINNEATLLADEKQMAVQQFNQKSTLYQLVQKNQENIAKAAKDSISTILEQPGGLQMYANNPQQAAYAEQIMGYLPGTITQLLQQQQQQADLKQIQDAGITTRYANVGGEIRDASTGYRFHDAPEFFAASGVSSWEEANQKGLIQDISQPKKDLIEVSPGASLFDPKTGQSVYTAPTTKQTSGGGGGGGNASQLTQAIIANPSLFDDLTPTNRGNVLTELQANGYNTSNLGVKGLSDTAINTIAQTQKALDDLNNLKSLIAGNEDKLGPITGLAALNPWSSARKLQADIDRVRQTVGKALEGGVLRKEDEEKYKKILATLTDTPSTAAYKIDALISSINRDIETYKSLQQSAGRSLDVGASLQKTGGTVEDLRTKYNY